MTRPDAWDADAHPGQHPAPAGPASAHAPDAPRPGGATAWRGPVVPDPADATGVHGHPYGPPGPPAGPYPPAVGALPPHLVDPRQVTALPVEDRSHPHFYRTPRWSWWRPVLAIVLAVVGALVLMTVPVVAGFLADGTQLDPNHLEKIVVGPWTFLGNNVGLALMIPLAMWTQWLVFRQRPKWLSSVQGGFRWRWFLTCVAWILPIWLVMIGVELLLGGLPPDVSVRPYTVLMIVGILLTTPFQAAGEEYLMRGLEQRTVASFFRNETVGWVVATLVSSLTFMALHGAADPWLNVFYFAFGTAAAWISWRTGGLEAAVAIHVVNNVLSEAFLPFTDFSNMFDRSAGVADWTVLIQVAVLLGATAVLAWRAKRAGIVRRTSPGRVEVERAQQAALAALGPYQAVPRPIAQHPEVGGFAPPSDGRNR